MPSSFARPIHDGWSIINAGADGKKFMINLKELTVIGSPPQIISFPFLELGSPNYRSWELHCNKKKIKDNGIFRSIAREKNTVRRIILDGMCGLNYDNRHWTLVAAGFDANFTILQSHIFIDLQSISRVNFPFSGLMTEILVTGWNDSDFVPYHSEQIIADCNNKARYASRLINEGQDFTVLENAVPNSTAHSVNLMLCSNRFQVRDSYESRKQGSQITPSNLESIIEKSMSQCETLGFIKGTERFGDCVLKLSK